MADPARAARLAQRIKVLVAEALRQSVKEPGVENITITETRVTNDLQHATVYYTIMGDAEAKAEATASLERSRGILRREVGHNLNIRLTPTLEFIADELPESASQLEELIRQTKERDQQLAEAAEGAQFAGGEDPYKKPEEAAEEQQ
ncbi:30S ribosome-binding factor RbfA [Acaricomes phytoseiuli]|uniref:30S ribosome-binding factor RbfA n=1 Tax=Acaricomes phytoseiuli TaxID=291968 RepID=UPI000362CFE6|nr:30S ribosome-binding factor RbfA [Acaricomes phytoseiuli]MCW1250661.1 30S ribosome-binding factor RbfA [Acaricomes phytoseiuli]